MRLFVGISLSEDIIHHIHNFQKKYEFLPVRWTSEKNLHVTILPPWYENDIDSVVESISSVVLEEKLRLEFEEVTFAPRGRPRLIWAKGNTPLSLISLHQQLLRVLGKKPIRRPLLLHTTIARFKPEDYYEFSMKELHEAIAWEMEIKEIILYESILSQEGADYFPVARFSISI